MRPRPLSQELQQVPPSPTTVMTHDAVQCVAVPKEENMQALNVWLHDSNVQLKIAQEWSKHEIGRLQTEKKQQQHHNYQLQAQNQQLNDQNSQLRKENGQLKNQNQQLKDHNGQVKKQNRQLQLNEAQSKHQIGQLQDQNDRLQAKNQLLHIHNVDCLQKSNASKQLSERLIGENDTLIGENYTFRGVISDLQQELAALKEVAALDKAEIFDLKDAVQIRDQANKPDCLFFKRGACKRGERCKFRHAQTSPP